MKSHWIEHQGKRIFYADYSSFGDDADALYQEAEPAIQTLAAEPEKSALVIANFEGTNSSIMNSDVFKQLLPKSNPSVKRRAFLGMGGAKKFFLTTLNSLMSGSRGLAFDSLDQALEWIIKD